MSTPAWLRVLLLALLAIALLLPAPWRGPPAGDAAVWLDDGESSLAPLLLSERPPPLLVRAASAPPSAGELEMLSALARRSALVVARPGESPALRIEPPAAGLREGYRGALRFTVRGMPGDSVPVTLLEGGVAVDSLKLAFGERGEARGAFRLRPASAGWHDWDVAAAGVVGRSGAWVAEAAPPRVLLASGPPTWESRFAARALEEAGAAVTVTQSLGRGLRVGESFPATLDLLRGYDVVLLFGGVSLDAGRLALLERFVAEAGGGVLVAGAEQALPALGLADGVAGGGVLRGGAIAWSLPAELLPLPATATESAVEALDGLRPGTVPLAWRPDAGALLAVRALGRGHAAALGLRETWRWRMEGGRVDEHRDFWRALVDWLAGGMRERPVLRLEATRGPGGVPVDVWIYGDSSAAIMPLLLTRPDGRRERLFPLPAAGGREALRATFMPVGEGVHTLSLGDTGSVRAGFRASAVVDDDAPPGERAYAGDRWARLGLLAERSGGTTLPRDSLAEWMERRAAERGSGPDRRPPLRTMLLGIVVLLALGEWVLRRTRGLA